MSEVTEALAFIQRVSINDQSKTAVKHQKKEETYWSGVVDMAGQIYNHVQGTMEDKFSWDPAYDSYLNSNPQNREEMVASLAEKLQIGKSNMMAYSVGQGTMKRYQAAAADLEENTLGRRRKNAWMLGQVTENGFEDLQWDRTSGGRDANE